jgi:hypothetical protein
MAYRILGLDGGGAWALIEVKALISIFGSDNVRGHEVLRMFDLVAANSGGSIVLGGLVEDLTLGEMLAFFMDQQKREAMFSPTSNLMDKALETTLGFGPKYSADAKLVALEGLLPTRGARPIAGITSDIPGQSGAPVRLMIVGFDYDFNRSGFFRSVAAAGPALGAAVSPVITLAEAIHASTNAPVQYFDAPAGFPEHSERYWDGGVTGFNNPVLAAVTEALTLGVAAGEIAALSLGTGTVHLPPAGKGDASSAFTAGWQDSGLKNDLEKMASSILDDPPDSGSFIAHAITAGGGLPPPAISRVVRMSPLVSPVLRDGALAAPGAMTPAGFQALCNINMDAVKPAEVAAISAYADLWLADQAPNQMLHADGLCVAQTGPDGMIAAALAGVPAPLPDHGAPAPGQALGYVTFAAARAAWRALAGW